MWCSKRPAHGEPDTGACKADPDQKPNHPHGIKVMLEEADMVGRVQKIVEE
jgi:uncharacterized protein YwbE